MIKVLIKRNGNKFESLEVKGHANSADYGKDLVCAAISAVLTGGFNNLKDIDKLHIELKEGYALLEVNNAISNHDEIVIETIICQLVTIEETNRDHIQIKNI